MVVYASDVRTAGDQVTGVEIPVGQNVEATYPVAAIKASRNLAAAEWFVDELATGSGRTALVGAGFLAPR